MYMSWNRNITTYAYDFTGYAALPHRCFPRINLPQPRAVITLNNDLTTLDSEYNKLSDHVAAGERDDYNEG